MEEALLTPSKTTLFKPTPSKAKHALNQCPAPAGRSDKTEADHYESVKSPGDVLKVLQSQPDAESLTRCLEWLTSDTTSFNTFDIRFPSAQAAQIVFVLVNEIVPNYWHIWTGSDSQTYKRQRRLLLQCLTSVAGIGAIVARLRSLSSSSRDAPATARLSGKPSSVTQIVDGLVGFLEALVQKDNSVDRIWTAICIGPDSHTPFWKESVSQLATGRLLSAVAEAQDVVRRDVSTEIQRSWIGDGKLYSAWLGRNIYYMIVQENPNSTLKRKAVPRLLSKALTLGYTDQIVNGVFANVLTGEAEHMGMVRATLSDLASYEQKNILYTMIRLAISRMISSTDTACCISGIAALVEYLVIGNLYLQEALVDWLSGAFATGISTDLHSRRAVLAALSPYPDKIKDALQKLLRDFGDKLYIKHTPILHQEANVQTLLLVIGHVFRSDPGYIRNMTKSSTYIQAISNRLAASSTRSQGLGMIVGSVASALVDPPDKRMNFSMEKTAGEEAKMYRELTELHDVVGSLGDLKALAPESGSVAVQKGSTSSRKTRDEGLKVTPAITSKVISILEVDSDTSSEDETLPVYNRADFDEEEEDDDPTLIQRDKPTAPVYIRNLISGLGDSENYERHRLALLTASSLIRRKANFGTEVSDHIEELATQLVGLSDKYEMDKFQELRLQGMIAVLVAQPLKMGQWFSKTYYNGEYSMGQRASILTTLSMGARELAGYGEEDAALTGAITAPEKLFPSQKLPEKYHKIYAVDAAPVTALASKLERTMIQPMAAEAADQLIGPNALKVRTFSSRMEVEKKRKKAIPNELAKIVADGFFFPLTRLWSIQPQMRGLQNVFTHPFLLTHFLKTLSLILNASGSSTLSLPALTSEFWSLLLSLHTTALSAPPVLEALLFSFLTLLEINSNNQRAIAEDHAKDLLETQAWAEQIFEKIGGGSEEGDRIRMLAAGVLVRTKDVVEKYQRLLMGDLVNYM